MDMYTSHRTVEWSGHSRVSFAVAVCIPSQRCRTPLKHEEVLLTTNTVPSRSVPDLSRSSCGFSVCRRAKRWTSSVRGIHAWDGGHGQTSSTFTHIEQIASITLQSHGRHHTTHLHRLSHAAMIWGAERRG
jgi:hypothetical protein